MSTSVDLTTVDLASLSTGLLIGLALLFLVQIVLWVIAFVILAKTPSERITIGGRKWVWVIIIIFGESIGAILFLLLGRKSAAAVEPTTATPAATRAAAAADALYGASAPGAPSATVPPAPSTPAVPPAPAPSAPAAPAPTTGQAAEADAETPEALAGDAEIGTDGTGSGELP